MSKKVNYNEVCDFIVELFELNPNEKFVLVDVCAVLADCSPYQNLSTFNVCYALGLLIRDDKIEQSTVSANGRSITVYHFKHKPSYSHLIIPKR